jgi:hypothetical protein
MRAVLTLVTSLKRVGRWTGRSAIAAPCITFARQKPGLREKTLQFGAIADQTAVLRRSREVIDRRKPVSDAKIAEKLRESALAKQRAQVLQALLKVANSAELPGRRSRLEPRRLRLTRPK